MIGYRQWAVRSIAYWHLQKSVCGGRDSDIHSNLEKPRYQID
jgi:hypothetical protein